MFDIKPESLVSKTEKLLYNIWQELRRLNEFKPEPARPMRKATKGKGKAKGFVTCKQCGEKFDNRGKFFNHLKEHKKEG